MKNTMRAMVFKELGKPLELQEVPIPEPNAHQVLIQIATCAVCHTDLHIIDGELPNPKLPLILGHQIIGHIVKMGARAHSFKIGDRVGVPWLGKSCNLCEYCLEKQENLCDQAVYTGYHIDGGYAEYCVADASFIFPLPDYYDAIQGAPLLCAGMIGYRCLRMTEKAQRIGFFGFGASAHLLIQIIKYRKGEVYIFTRKNPTQNSIENVGASWIGNVYDTPPIPLDAAIIFAPVGALIPVALKAVKKGGIVVCAGIHMSDIPSFPYRILWEERSIRSVANLTKIDGEEFLRLAPKIPIQTTTTTYPLAAANDALYDLRQGKLIGSAVLCLNPDI